MSKSRLGLDEKQSCVLCYAFWWISGLVFLMLEEGNDVVRFHALQSLLTFLCIQIVAYVLMFIPVIGFFINFILYGCAFILWIVCMVKASRGELFKVPFFGDIAEKQVFYE